MNGHPKQQDSWSRVCGYVEQQVGRSQGWHSEQPGQPVTLRHSLPLKNLPPAHPPCPPCLQDIHSPGTTVREALVFSARLRLDESIGWDRVCGACSRWLTWGGCARVGPSASWQGGRPQHQRSGSVQAAAAACTIGAPPPPPPLQVTAIVDSSLETVDLAGLAGSIVGEPGGQGCCAKRRCMCTCSSWGPLRVDMRRGCMARVWGARSLAAALQPVHSCACTCRRCGAERGAAQAPVHCGGARCQSVGAAVWAQQGACGGWEAGCAAYSCWVARAQVADTFTDCQHDRNLSPPLKRW